jgi:hypothetical protein
VQQPKPATILIDQMRRAGALEGDHQRRPVEVEGRASEKVSESIDIVWVGFRRHRRRHDQREGTILVVEQHHPHLSAE